MSKKPGLYANIHAKRKRGEKMRKPGEEGAPSAQDFKDAAKTAKKKKGAKRQDPGRKMYDKDGCKMCDGGKKPCRCGKADMGRKGPYADGMCKRGDIAAEFNAVLINDAERSDKPCGNSYIPQNAKCSKGAGEAKKASSPKQRVRQAAKSGAKTGAALGGLYGAAVGAATGGLKGALKGAAIGGGAGAVGGAVMGRSVGAAKEGVKAARAGLGREATKLSKTRMRRNPNWDPKGADYLAFIKKQGIKDPTSMSINDPKVAKIAAAYTKTAAYKRNRKSIRYTR
jgi:hypothetical protein